MKADDMFTVIRRSDDGDVSVAVLTRDELEKRLLDDHYGPTTWLDRVPDADPNYWGSGSVGVIVRSGPVVPSKAETVTRWELP